MKHRKNCKGKGDDKWTRKYEKIILCPGGGNLEALDLVHADIDPQTSEGRSEGRSGSGFFFVS